MLTMTVLSSAALLPPSELRGPRHSLHLAHCSQNTQQQQQDAHGVPLFAHSRGRETRALCHHMGTGFCMHLCRMPNANQKLFTLCATTRRAHLKRIGAKKITALMPAQRRAAPVSEATCTAL
jgi:hypothetical protein